MLYREKRDAVIVVKENNKTTRENKVLTVNTGLISNTMFVYTTPTNVSLNGEETDESEEDPECFYVFIMSYHILSLILIFLIICMNSFTIILILRKKYLRKPPGNHLLLSLSMNHLLAGISFLFHILPDVYFKISGCREDNAKLQESFIDISKVSYMLSKYCLLLSVAHLLALSTDRICAIFFALRYDELITIRKIRLGIALVWLLTLILALFDIDWLFIDLDTSREKVYTIVFTTIFAITPAVLLGIQYIVMLSLIHRLIQRSVTGMQRRQSMASERKALIVYIVMYISFLIFSLPFFIMRLMVAFHPNIFLDTPETVLHVLILFRFLTAFTDPMLYIFYKKDFRRALNETFGCVGALRHHFHHSDSTEMSQFYSQPSHTRHSHN